MLKVQWVAPFKKYFWGWGMEGYSFIKKIKTWYAEKYIILEFNWVIMSILLFQTLSQTCPDHTTAMSGSPAPDEHRWLRAGGTSCVGTAPDQYSLEHLRAHHRPTCQNRQPPSCQAGRLPCSRQETVVYPSMDFKFWETIIFHCFFFQSFVVYMNNYVHVQSFAAGILKHFAYYKGRK